ncbi:MAG: efflux RND transporter periplasmic adaptor subunit [Deltaproteobacteria bacterium]|nr:efflux RND transporter periplasmic adaptor subunit [Deltaproteobacteria bacterium]
MSDQLSSDLASLRINREEAPGRGRGLRLILALAAVAGLVAVGYFVGLPLVESKVFKAEVSLTEVSLISPAQAQVQLTATGYVVPQTLSKVSAKVQGRVARVLVREGDLVRAGQKLLELETSDQRAAIAAAASRVLAARATAATARARLAEAQQQLARERLLAARGASAKAVAQDLAARVTSLDGEVKAADAQAKVAQAEVTSLQVNLGHAIVLAPIGGTVITKPPAVGELVGPASPPLLEVADFATLMLEADVPEGRLHLVRKEAPCEIVLDAFPSRRYRGAVHELSQRVNRAKATVIVKVKFVDAAEGVLPDMAGRINVLERALDAATMKEPPKLVVPGGAVADRQGAKVVFVLENGALRMVPVTLGPPLGGGFVLERGPGAGTKVVKNPLPSFTDGQRVKERSE